MNFAKQVAKIQNLFGASKIELTVVTLILSGLLVGQFVTLHEREDLQEISQQLEAYNSAMSTTFVGIDNEGNINKDLALADTVINKESGFPSSKPKQELVGKIDINKASKVELMKLKGVGESTARRIIEYRKKRQFTTIADIQNVKGIGPKKFENLREHIFVGGISSDLSTNEKPGSSPQEAEKISDKSNAYSDEGAEQGVNKLININTASKTELMKLKGIGQKTAERIIEYRNQSPFRTIEDIQKVKGIGPKKFENIKEHITVKSK